MDEKAVKAMCAAMREKMAAMHDKKTDPKEKELFDLGFSLVEAHLVNQARMADTLNRLLIHVRQN